jgi:hypothetical protein
MRKCAFTQGIHGHIYFFWFFAARHFVRIHIPFRHGKLLSRLNNPDADLGILSFTSHSFLLSSLTDNRRCQTDSRI